MVNTSTFWKRFAFETQKKCFAFETQIFFGIIKILKGLFGALANKRENLIGNLFVTTLQ